MGSEFPDQGLNLCLLHWKHRVLSTGPPGKSLVVFFYNTYLFIWLLQVFVAACGFLVVACGLLSSGMQVFLSLVVVHGLQGAWAL